MFCVSIVKVQAALYIDRVNAAVDMPSATRSRNRLFLVTTVCCGRASRMSTKSLILSAMQDQLTSATCSI